jgi:Nif-specific regulatory protein
MDRCQDTETRRLSTLLEISRMLGSTSNLRSALTSTLEIVEERHDTVSSAVTLLDPDLDELTIEAATGMPWRKSWRTRYRVGEGITGRVVQSGRYVVVPRVSQEPLFLNRTGVWKENGHGELSFVCVPIHLGDRAVGSLGVTLRYEEGRDFAREAQFLGVVASMIVQALRVHRLIESEREKLLSENSQLRQELRERYQFPNLIGSSSEMRDVFEQIARVAGGQTTVLIRGESGTGKELIAHAIHYNSSREGRPFVKVNCGALPETLIESELFGYEPGAFTDARSRKRGRFEMANGGTLFLDEVGELSPSTQVKLLRALQEQEFERLGGTETMKVDVRVVAATNKDLEAGLRAGTFREDLYYRLNVFSIFMPPLRDREPDILLLADHFLEKYATAAGKNVRRISTPAIDMLVSYHWPGNVRELENCMERAVLLSTGGVIHAHDLPPTLQTAEISGTAPRTSLDSAVGAYEKDLIVDGLKSARGNQAQAARLLQTTARIIGYKVQKYGIDVNRFRP